MKHFAPPTFWRLYKQLPHDKLADKNYDLLCRNPRHPSLHFKKIGIYWSVRVGLDYRDLALMLRMA
jgi:hypothetical protein